MNITPTLLSSRETDFRDDVDLDIDLDLRTVTWESAGNTPDRAHDYRHTHQCHTVTTQVSYSVQKDELITTLL